MPASPPSAAPLRRQAPAPESDKLTYVYVTSVAHSGTTLLGCLLGGHPQVTTVGEFGAPLKNGWDFLCSCGVKLADCSLWQDWRREAEREGLAFAPGNLGVNIAFADFTSLWDRLNLHLFPHRSIDGLRNLALARWSSTRRRAAATIDRALRLAQLLCRLQGTNVFLDTAKPAHNAPHLARRPDIDFRMISLIRDGRGVMKSLMEREHYSPNKAIRHFIWGHRYRIRAEAYIPADRVYHLRLKDLCADPEGTLRALAAFMGVDPEAPLDLSQANRHIIGNSMRMKFDGSIRLDVSWRKALSKQHLDLFEARAGWLNRQLGYTD